VPVAQDEAAWGAIEPLVLLEAINDTFFSISLLLHSGQVTSDALAALGTSTSKTAPQLRHLKS
jgi:hypothetical protein